ncbi:putative Cyclic AMP-dependent transcription factor ATF-6 beta-like protein [Naja naja]|nr:putative Cyclic AMP-dependent transcription factor ATF-6 beta-like protein [Naja naja]
MRVSFPMRFRCTLTVPVGGYAGQIPPRLSHGWAEVKRRGIPLGGGIAMAIIDWVEVGAGNSIYRKGGRKMAALASELLLLSDSSRFRADNLLSSEDWDAGLYSCLDNDGDMAAELFPCLEHSIMDSNGISSVQFGDGFDLDMETMPPDPPWDPLQESLFPELQVKSEPVSPASSHCSDSSVASSDSSVAGSSSAELSEQIAGPGDVIGVKTEHPPTPPCMFGDVLLPPFGTVHINVVPASETESILSRKAPIQPKPVVVTTVPGQPATSSSKTILLQPVPVTQSQTVNPGITAQSVVISQSELLHLPVSGLIKVQSPVKEVLSPKPAPSIPKPEAKTIIPAPAQIGPCNQEIDIKVLKRQQRMIKIVNRLVSPRKKKEYLQGLESRLREALAENGGSAENAILGPARWCPGQNSDLKFGSGNRKVICVMVVLLFIAFNFGPVSITERKVADMSQPKQEPDGWVRRHQINRRKPLQTRKAAQSSQVGQDNVLRGRKTGTEQDSQKLSKAYPGKPQKKPPSPSHYVPASPPKYPEGDSLRQLQSLYGSSLGYEVMMQVDCEVMDTRVIHIKSSTVPPFLRRQGSTPSDNRTQPSPPAFSGKTPRTTLRSHRSTLSTARRHSHRTLYFGEHGGG